MTHPTFAALAVAALLGSAALAHADCPDAKQPDVCTSWIAPFLPTVFTEVFVPGNAQGPWYGGGLELSILAWSNNSPAHMPSQGRLRFDIAALGSGVAGAGTMAMYRSGVQLSLEHNASRQYLIPYFSTDVGALWTQATNTQAFVDGGLGVYLWHQRSLIVDLEVAGLLPFKDPGALGGVRSQLAISFSLW